MPPGPGVGQRADSEGAQWAGCRRTASAGGYAYFGTASDPYASKVVKVDLSTFTEAGKVTLDPADQYLSTAVISPDGRYGYFGTPDAPGRILEVDLGTTAKVGELTMAPGESYLRTSVIDPNGDYAYFGTHTSPGRVVKVRVGARYTLRAAATTVRDAPAAELAWAGASTPDVDVVRDGTVIATVPNTGGHLDRIPGAGSSPYSHQVCDTGSDHCSNTVTVSLTT